MNRLKISSIAIGFLTLLWSLTAPAQGTVVYDQRSFTGSPQADQITLIGTNQPFGQSFTPSLSAVGFINLVLYGGGAGTGPVFLEIHANSIAGPVIGTSESLFFPTYSGGVVTFKFDTAVSVTPGTMYYFQPIVGPSGSNFATPAIAFLGYPGGTAIYQGNSLPNVDLEFQEGIYVPEPSTWALLLLGAGALWFLRRKS